MNIKSILLGSAAAFFAVSGARAADAVVMVEPEPVEYVRVCDVYGTGYFYIPGTETCLKIGGYVRVRLQAADESLNRDFKNDNDQDPKFPRFADGPDYDVNTRVRGRLEFDAREETELGTLRSFIRLQGTNFGNGSTTSFGGAFDQAYLQLGGLTVGYLDSLWAEKDGLYTDNDWSVGDFSQNRVSYTYASNGFSAAISAEDDGSGDYVPDVVAQLAYEGGFGSAYVSGVFDEQRGLSSNSTFQSNYRGFSFDADDGKDVDDAAFAVKGGVELKDLIAADSSLKIEGHYAFNPTEYAGDAGGYLVSGNGRYVEDFGANAGDFANTGGNGAFNFPSEYQIGVGYQQQFGKLFLAGSAVYGKTFDLDHADGADFSTGGGAEYIGGALNAGYDITSNLSTLAEVSYRNIDLPVEKFDQVAGFLELKRSF